jgi:hypothetical protein
VCTYIGRWCITVIVPTSTPQSVGDSTMFMVLVAPNH